MATEPAMCNVNEMAAEIGISPNLLRRQAKAGRIPHVFVGGRLLFSRTQVVAFLQRLAEESVREPSPTAAARSAVRRRRRVVQSLPVGRDAHALPMGGSDGAA